MWSVTAEYALRALVRMSFLDSGAAISGRDLARDAQIPPHYLAKVLHPLRNAEIVTTARGTHGGYRLSKPATGIHLLEVVELFDGPRSRPSCLLGVHHDCTDSTPCSAYRNWLEMRNSFNQFLESTTIATLANADQGPEEIAAEEPDAVESGGI